MAQNRRYAENNLVDIGLDWCSVDDMNKKQVSILVPERLVDLADQAAVMVGQSRAFVMTRWMLESLGMTAEEMVEYFPRGVSTSGEAQNKKNRDVSGVGVREGASVAPDPVFGGMAGSEPPLADSGFLDAPVVPEQVFAQLAALQAAHADLSGVSPEVVKSLQTKKKGARTVAGVERVVQQLTATATVLKPKKIAVVPSPDVPPPVFETDAEIEEPILYGRPGVLPEGHIAPGQDVVVPRQAHEIYAHNPDTCAVYGCLMCKSIKEKK